MFLYLKPLFTGERNSLPIDCEMDFSGSEYQNVHSFPQPVRVRGEVKVSADIVTLRATANFVYVGQCDRCAADYQRPMEVPMEHILVTSLNNEENDDFVLVNDYQLLLDELTWEDIILSLPSKSLCRENCRGLCPTCGKNLNEGLCGCRSDTIDPRLEALRQFMDQ